MGAKTMKIRSEEEAYKMAIARDRKLYPTGQNLQLLSDEHHNDGMFENGIDQITIMRAGQVDRKISQHRPTTGAQNRKLDLNTAKKIQGASYSQSNAVNNMRQHIAEELKREHAEALSVVLNTELHGASVANSNRSRLLPAVLTRNGLHVNGMNRDVLNTHKEVV